MCKHQRYNGNFWNEIRSCFEVLILVLPQKWWLQLDPRLHGDDEMLAIV